MRHQGFLFASALKSATVACILMPLSAVVISAEAETTLSPWWGTACHFINPEELTQGLTKKHGYVSFRKFPVTPQSIEDPQRSIAISDRGVTFKIDGRRATIEWRDSHVEVLVAPLGAHNSAVAMTVVVNDRVVGDGVFGNMELACWRPLEDLIEKYSPGSIKGSPPRPHLPLHDANGNVIPESSEQ